MLTRTSYKLDGNAPITNTFVWCIVFFTGQSNSYFWQVNVYCIGNNFKQLPALSLLYNVYVLLMPEGIMNRRIWVGHFQDSVESRPNNSALITDQKTPGTIVRLKWSQICRNAAVLKKTTTVKSLRKIYKPPKKAVVTIAHDKKKSTDTLICTHKQYAKLT